MPTHTVTLHRVLRCSADRVYRAFITPEALVKWLPPNGFTASVHEIDARVGGSYRMSFTNFATGHGHSFGGRYLELVPGRTLRYTAAFDDTQLGCEMHTTVTIEPVSCGVALHVVQQGIPEPIPAESCQLGWQESLALLAALVEAEIPG